MNALCRKRVNVRCGHELFGVEHKLKYAVIVRALYDLASAGTSWRAHFASIIKEELGHDSMMANPNVHIKAKLKPDGSKCYAYLVVYVDNILIIDLILETSMNVIGWIFHLKDRIEKPSIYLGSNMKEWEYCHFEG